MQKKLSFLLIAWIMIVMTLGACAGLTSEATEVQPASTESETAVVPALNNTDIPPIVPAVQTDVQDSSPPSPTLPETAAGLQSLLAQQQVLVNIYETINPSVVNIQLVGQGQGSGFVYNEAGFIVTNNHVVEGGQNIVVTFANGTEATARLIGTDPDSDLAVIKVDELPTGVVAIPLADSDALKVGQMVIAIGNPFGLQGSMTTGIVSGLGRLLPSTAAPNGGRYNIPNVIQTDAAINPGNSGGPLLDLSGQVIGVNSAIESPVRGSSGIGLAVPSNIVRVVVPQLIERGQVAHPWLGISGQTLDSDLAEAIGLDSDQRGILVGRIEPTGPAAAAGLRSTNGNDIGDVIVGIDDEEIQDFDDLLGYVVQHTEVGQTVTLHLLRDSELDTVLLTLGARPTN